MAYANEDRMIFFSSDFMSNKIKQEEDMEERDLTICDVARMANCHINTVRNYEKRGYIKSMRDNNNFRRYSKQEAIKLRAILEIRKPAK